MINCKCTFDSMILGTRMNVDVYLPHPFNYLQEVSDYQKHYKLGPFKTLYLFHGVWNSGEQWVENTSILRYAEEENMAVVILNVGNSYYANAYDGKRFENFVVEELIGFVRGIFPLSEKREDNFALGMSMGGYGILNIAFKYPHIFSKCAMLSPVTDIVYSIRFLKTLGLPAEGIFGKWKDLRGSKFDLKVIFEENEKNMRDFPEILVIYGNKDDMTPGTKDFKEFLDAKGFKADFREYEGGHTWQFWDEHTKECIDFIR